MRLRRKLLIVHGIVAAVAVVAFCQLHVSTQRVAEEYHRQMAVNEPQADALQALLSSTHRLFGTTNEIALLAGLAGSLDRGRWDEGQANEAAELREALAAQAMALTEYGELTARSAMDDGALILDLEVKGQAMVAASIAFLAGLEKNPSADDWLAAWDRLEEAEDGMVEAISLALAHQDAVLAGYQARTRAAIAASGRLVALAILLVPVLLLGAAQIVDRTVVGPIGQLTAATARVAAGGPALIARSGAGDEIGDLIAAFGEMSQDLASSQTRARHLALHDALTELPNRVLLAERLTQALVHARRHGDPPAVICLDLDRFKDVNDTLGHAIGDLLLREVAKRLSGCARDTDTVARLGGDEFAVVQVGASQPGDAEALCRRLLAALSAPYRLDGHDVLIGASLGVAVAPADGDDPATLLRHADIALYRAKGDGRGAARFFEEGMNRQLQVRRALETDLRRALSEGQFELRYQPQLELTSGRVVGIEALLRWRHPERGEVQPMDFIPLAEETGLIVPIGAWVLRAAAIQALEWPGLRMAVNLSAVQFRQPGLIETVAQVLRETGLEPNRLELEITEGVLMEETEACIKILDALKGLGVRIAMDDFGTGYSSLSYLRRFPFDKIKIDRSFVADLGSARGTNASAIVRAVVSLGASLGMTTTAEGIEIEAQAALLREEGCDEVQGYLYARPMRPADLTQWLGQHGWAAGDSGRWHGMAAVPDAVGAARAAALTPA